MTSPGTEPAHLRFDVWRSGIGQPVKVQITDTRTGRVVTATEPTEIQARARCAEQMAAPTLSEWLLQQMAEDERVARRAQSGRYTWSEAVGFIIDECTDADLDACHAFASRHDPARVLAKVAAERRIVELHVRLWSDDPAVCRTCHVRYDAAAWPCMTLRFLALPYAGQPGYREQWRP